MTAEQLAQLRAARLEPASRKQPMTAAQQLQLRRAASAAGISLAKKGPTTPSRHQGPTTPSPSTPRLRERRPDLHATRATASCTR
jgi:hypothetical protein